MKLYVICRGTGEKVYLTFSTPVFERKDISPSFSVICPNGNYQEFFTNRDVYAEPETTNMATSGAILGGLIGLLVGPEGALIGGILGGAVGAGAKENDLKAVRRFNQS